MKIKRLITSLQLKVMKLDWQAIEDKVNDTIDCWKKQFNKWITKLKTILK